VPRSSNNIIGDSFQSGNAIVQYGGEILKRRKGEEAAMISCPECESDLDIELDEIEEGDVVTCNECGTEFEVVGVEPLELARAGDEDDEDDDDFFDDEEEEEEEE
jgi:alpha-aminoadipate carrier protein LysW